MELLRWVFACFIGNIKIKYFLICILSVEFSAAITFKSCANQFNAQRELDFTYCYFDNYTFKKGENQSLSFCFTPQSDLQNILIGIKNSTASYLVAQPMNFKGKYLNKLVFTSYKFMVGASNNYLFEIKFGNDKIYSTQLPLWQLENQQTVILFYGLVVISTNCESGLSPTTFSGCSVGIEKASKDNITLCFFDGFYPMSIGDARSVKFCFHPEPSLRYLSATLVNDDINFFFSLSTSDLGHFKPNEWNEVSLTMSKTSHQFFTIITFQNSQLDLAQSDVQFFKKLKLYLIGDWKGSREFTSDNDRDFTNCFNEQQFLSSNSATEVITLTEETTNSIENEMTTESDGDGQSELSVGSLGLHYIVAIAVVSLLTIGLVCALLAFLHYQNKKRATAGATTNEISIQELNEGAQRNENEDVVNEPYNINVLAADILQEEEVKYTRVSFGTNTQKKGKPKKPPRKPPRVTKTSVIKPLNEETVETVYSTILPEVQIENEEVQYMNVGEHAVINSPIRDHDVVLYANIND